MEKEIIMVLDYFFGSLMVAATLIAGIWLKTDPPKKINNIYGFRTKATSQNQETWNTHTRSVQIPF
ncbi:MAG: SdpI family protein [Dehalococcoidia bacterium]|nr:SdpI family protein [Dehalococcoidia bacterium]